MRNHMSRPSSLRGNSSEEPVQGHDLGVVPTLLQVCVHAAARYLPDAVQIAVESVPAEHLQDAIWDVYSGELSESTWTTPAALARHHRALQQFAACRTPHAVIINWHWLRSSALPALHCLGHHLHHLSLARTAVDNLAALAGLQQLRCLSLAGCNWLLPPTLTVLLQLTQLEAVDLSHLEHLGDAAAPYLAQLPCLRLLQLSYSHISDVTLQWLTYQDRVAAWQAGALPLHDPTMHLGTGSMLDQGTEARRSTLQRLHLAHTRITPAGCQLLCSLQLLQFLDVRGTGIPGYQLRPLQSRFKLVALQGGVLSRTLLPVGPPDVFVCCCDPSTLPQPLQDAASSHDQQSGARLAPLQGDVTGPVMRGHSASGFGALLSRAGVPHCEQQSVLVASQRGINSCIPQLLVLEQVSACKA